MKKLKKKYFFRKIEANEIKRPQISLSQNSMTSYWHNRTELPIVLTCWHTNKIRTYGSTKLFKHYKTYRSHNQPYLYKPWRYCTSVLLIKFLVFTSIKFLPFTYSNMVAVSPPIWSVRCPVPTWRISLMLRICKVDFAIPFRFAFNCIDMQR